MILSRLLPGVALVFAALAAVAKSRSALLHGHWAYPALLAVVAVVGVLLVLWAFLGDKPKPGRGRALGRWAGAAAGTGLAALTLWLAPYPALARPAAAVGSDRTGIWMGPADATTGVAFIPGALVDPSAYENILAPVAEAGYAVYIAKPAFGLAFSVPDVVADARDALPDVQQWVVAGHSLGGAVASGQTADAAGVILLGSFPIGDIAGTGVPVLSITATNDGLTTPDDVTRTAGQLPATTEFVEIDGGIHAFFGDYGPQRGDGDASITRAEQQQQTQSAIEDFLGRLPPPAP